MFYYESIKPSAKFGGFAMSTQNTHCLESAFYCTCSVTRFRPLVPPVLLMIFQGQVKTPVHCFIRAFHYTSNACANKFQNTYKDIFLLVLFSFTIRVYILPEKFLCQHKHAWKVSGALRYGIMPIYWSATCHIPSLRLPSQWQADDVPFAFSVLVTLASGPLG